MGDKVGRWRAWSWLALICLLLPASAFARTIGGVGFAAIEVPDPISGRNMAGFVFYPSAREKGLTVIGSYELDASRDAAIDPGAKPLVVISHGHAGSDLGHHDLATYLARHGFVVATIMHPKDNFRDSSGDGQPVVLSGRPLQISATISYLLQNPRWKSFIDPDRIGVAGFSNGGYTALRIVGAEPNFTGVAAHCRQHPDDRNICAPLAKFEKDAAQHGGTVKQAVDELQRGLAQWGKTSDPRVKAAFVMAPFSSVFDAAGLAPVSRPVFLYYAQDDQVLLPRYNALHLVPLIRTLAGIDMVPRAGHYVFLAPCSQQLTESAPDICRDPAGVDRIAVHRQINARALAFFRKSLHVRGD